MIKKLVYYIPALFLTIFYSACIPSDVAIKQDYNFNVIRTVGVSEFSSANTNTSSGKIVQEAFARYLLSKGIDVKIINSQRGDELVSARVSKVDVLITGTVTQYSPDQKYLVYLGEDNKDTSSQKVVVSIPTITEVSGANVYGWGRAYGVQGQSELILTSASVGVSATMIDTITGTVIWSNSYAYEGLDVNSALEGLVRFMFRSLKTVWPVIG